MVDALRNVGEDRWTEFFKDGTYLSQNGLVLRQLTGREHRDVTGVSADETAWHW